MVSVHQKRIETAELQRPEQIPSGMTEDEVDTFWLTHSLGDDLLEQMEPFPDDFPLPFRAQHAAQGEPSRAKSKRVTHGPSTGQIILGVAAAGVLAVGCYVAYRIVWANAGVNKHAFLPTRAPHLKISRLASNTISMPTAPRKALSSR